MTTPTWVGVSRVVNGTVVTKVHTVPAPDREVPIAVCAAADAVTVEHGT
jgi:hypothetical protein